MERDRLEWEAEPAEPPDIVPATRCRAMRTRCRLGAWEHAWHADSVRCTVLPGVGVGAAGSPDDPGVALDPVFVGVADAGFARFSM